MAERRQSTAAARRAAFAALALAAVACGLRERPPAARATAGGPVTDRCDEDPMAGAGFFVRYVAPFRIWYLPGTAAERDLAAIAARRAAALLDVTTKLALDEPRTLEIVLSPSRLAARAHGVGTGGGSPWNGYFEVLYLDDPTSYEQVAYGHELTHAVAWHLDPDAHDHLRFLEEGLAEYFDHSGRDPHRSFVTRLRARSPSLPLEHAVRFDDADVLAWSYPKAASFVKLLFEISPDPARFKAFYGRTRTGWSAGDRAERTPLTSDGRPLDAAAMSTIVDDGLRAVYGIDLARLSARWVEVLRPHTAAPYVLGEADRRSIAQILDARDRAMATGDAALYRATMEGFACDRIDDGARMKLAERMVAPHTAARSVLRDAYDMGIRNYPEAFVTFERDDRRPARTVRAKLERYPVGWRLDAVEDEPSTDAPPPEPLRGDGTVP